MLQFLGFISFITNFYTFTNHHVRTEDLKMFLCGIHRIFVALAAIFSIYSKVDSFPPITLFIGPLSPETFNTIVDYFWICISGSMPKPRACGRYAISQFHAVEFSLVTLPKINILDDMN